MRTKSSKSRPFVFVTSYQDIQLGHRKKVVPLCTSVCGLVSLVMPRDVSFAFFSEGPSLGTKFSKSPEVAVAVEDLLELHLTGLVR